MSGGRYQSVQDGHMWLTVFQCSLLLISSMWSIYHKKVRLTVMLGELLGPFSAPAPPFEKRHKNDGQVPNMVI